MVKPLKNGLGIFNLDNRGVAVYFFVEEIIDTGSTHSKYKGHIGQPLKLPVQRVLLTLIDVNDLVFTPKMIAIDHDYSKRPLQLFWMDGLALQAIAEEQDETILLTEITEDNSGYPRKPALETLAEFKTTPSIHAGYAATWYGLSIAGVYMTRKLITRGRG